MPQLRLFPVLALALCTTAAVAQATPERAYLRVGLGPSQWQAACEGTRLCDRGALAAQAGLGYRVFGGLAVEVGVADFGRLELANNVLDVNVRAQGLLLGAAWHVNLGPTLTASVRGGLAQLEVSQTVTSGSGTTGNTRSRAEPYVGASVGLPVSPQIVFELAGTLTHLRQNQQGLDLRRGRIGVVTLGVRASF